MKPCCIILAMVQSCVLPKTSSFPILLSFRDCDVHKIQIDSASAKHFSRSVPSIGVYTDIAN